MNFLWIHLALMSTVFIISFVAGLIAKFLRKKNWWLKVHKILNQIKTLCAIFGFIIAILMVNSFKINHFSTIHGIIGLFVFVFIILQSSGGVIIVNKFFSTLKIIKEKEVGKILRSIHKKAGIFIILFILINLVIGLSKIF